MSKVQELFDRAKKAFPGTGMYDGVPVKLEYTCGFEAYNLRPYECYETWCCGFSVLCEREDGTKRGTKARTAEAAAEQALAMCYPEVQS